MFDRNSAPHTFKVKKACLAGLLCFISTYASSSLAACSALNGWTNRPLSVQLSPTIKFYSDMPVGTILDTKQVSAPNQPFIVCDAPQSFSGRYWPPISGPGPIGNTGVAGVGVRITMSNGGINYILPFSPGILAPGTYSWINSTWTIELIKTGPITAGQMPAGAYAGYGSDAGYFSAYLNITGGGQIVPVACTVTTASIPVPMGSARPNQFAGVGSAVGERDVIVPLNCEANTKVNIRLDGTADSSGAPGVLALNPSSTTPVARGVGLQLLHNGAPVKLGTPIAIGTAAAAGPFNITLRARYYQTAVPIIGGQANSTATFTMTYN